MHMYKFNELSNHDNTSYQLVQRQLVRPVARQFPQTFMQRPNEEAETPKHKTLNNALVSRNEVLSITWKLSEDHAPTHT